MRYTAYAQIKKNETRSGICIGYIALLYIVKT